MKKTLPLFLSLAFLFMLTACGGAGSGNAYTPWNMPATGIVTKDPDSIPNIAWQTENQRDALSSQSATFAKEQTTSEQAAAANDPNRPSLQTVVGGAAPIPRKVKAALLLPLTGKNADLGQSMLKAAQMALFDVGSSNFELSPIDTKSTTAGAAAAVQLASKTGAKLILGPIFADDVRAVKPVASAANLPVIAFTTDWTIAGNDTYIMGFLPFAQVARVAQYAQSKGLTRVGVFAPQTEYCDVVISTLQRTGTTPVKIARYSPQQPDLSSIVQDFAATSKDASGAMLFDTLMIPVGGESLRSVVSTLEQSGMRGGKVRLIGTGLWDDASLTNDPALYGGWFAAPDPALRRDFEKRYSENYGASPLRLASLAYDATALAAVLARTSGGNDSYTKTHLTNARGFAGIDGVFRFRGDGLSERGLAVLEIQSGKARVIDPAPTAFIASGT